MREGCDHGKAAATPAARHPPARDHAGASPATTTAAPARPIAVTAFARQRDDDAWERGKQLSRMLFQEGLTAEDRDWLRHHIELSGQQVPSHDTSWITMEWIRC